jgi:two-component system, OmpR family, phosphate regulon sensor histidine kinase PhoR
MKQHKNNIFIAISYIALLAVLIIQINWILQTAKIKEELFSEKANMILSKTTEAILSDQQTCREIGISAEKERNVGVPAKLGKNEIHKIDSLFNYNMRFYNFYIDYTFEVVNQKQNTFTNENNITNYIYNMPLNDLSGKSSIELKLIFPDKKQFIIAEMGALFITSVVLIIIVLVLFWQTILSLTKEKKISEHTSDFLNNMTHEFKTPLTNIALASKMLVKGYMNKDDSKTIHYSEIILEENEKLRLQIEQVLSMTALERGEIPLQKTILDFHQLIQTCLKCMSMQIEEKQGSIQLNLDAHAFAIEGDKTHLINSICNLIDNAIKYAKEKPVISIQTASLNGQLILVFSDNGLGIEKEYHKHVFDKFFRVPTGNIHNVKGFGLGLAYVKKIIDLHYGTIELKSERSKGTLFTIKLPHA